ncbi:uncharacterized protein [Drosophila pseudoobscura]|uniref:Uncharacterized protein n=1 Tax=Drosophila pseudoobscura pseudoobscura TaxID=46245 RepID=A0A6I8VAL6_DROPS|nr:uncharacterized protein LOC26532815 [Drosophila pseudoobscura]
MQSCLIIALAVLSLANAVPNDPESHAPTESESESESVTESDRIHLCEFLASFVEIKRGLNRVILGYDLNHMARANELVVEKAALLKDMLSEEAAASEQELFDDVKRFEESRKTGIRQVTNIMKSLDRKFKAKYRC